MAAHEFITIGNRRWCLGCDLFQQRSDRAVDFAKPSKGCARSTPRARADDEIDEKKWLEATK